MAKPNQRRIFGVTQPTTVAPSAAFTETEDAGEEALAIVTDAPPPGLLFGQVGAGRQRPPRQPTLAGMRARVAYAFQMSVRGNNLLRDRDVARWDGGRDRRTGRTYEPVWDRVADVCRSLQADPWEYVSAYFLFGDPAKAQPNVLVGERGLAAWQLALDDTPAACVRDFTYAKNLLQAEASICAKIFPNGYDGLRYALRNRSISAPPVVRYAVAAAVPELSDVQQEWLRPAVVDYAARRRRCQPALQYYLPQELIQQGEAYLASVQGVA